MILTLDSLLKISPGTPAKRMEPFVAPLNEYLPKYGIDTAVEVASFLSQVLHESGGFRWMKEIWGPSKAQKGYEGRTDLGNTEPGDGKKFAGRGPLQITGRENFTKMSMEMFGDLRLLETPELLSTPIYGVWSACIFWKWKNMDAVDDDNSIAVETKRTNGGYNGLDDRQRYFDRCKVEFGIAL